MCNSALVAQRIKSLGLKYDARIQLDAFEELFVNRLAGSGAKVSRSMEADFLITLKSAQDLRIEKSIRAFHEVQMKDAQQLLFAQIKRLADAERTLLVKVTKKAQNDQRVATDKIEKAKGIIALLKSDAPVEAYGRIFPHMYAPLIHEQKGERVISPFRYLLRPHGQPESFDRKYNGAYNARRDSLDRVFWWKSLYGRSHGVMEIKSFWENVLLHEYEQRKLKPGEVEQKIVLRFTPDALEHMLVPCIFDTNSEGEFPLHSMALLTDDPNPEVKAAGHDRTPVIMRDSYLDLWLCTSQKGLERYEPVFTDKQPTYFEHAIAA